MEDKEREESSEGREEGPKKEDEGQEVEKQEERGQKQNGSQFYAPKSKEEENQEIEDLRAWVEAIARERGDMHMADKYNSLIDSLCAKVSHLEFRIETLVAKQKQLEGRPPSSLASSAHTSSFPANSKFGNSKSSFNILSTRKSSVTECDVLVVPRERGRSGSIVEGIENFVPKASLPFKRRRNSNVKDEEVRDGDKDGEVEPDATFKSPEGKSEGKGKGRKKKEVSQPSLVSNGYLLSPYSPGEGEKTARPLSPRSPRSTSRTDSKIMEKVFGIVFHSSH